MTTFRLDFQTFSGFTVSTVAASRGACTDSFAAAGQTSVNPPTICGTNTGYHSNAGQFLSPNNSPPSLLSVRRVRSRGGGQYHSHQHLRRPDRQVVEHPGQADLLHRLLEVSWSLNLEKNSPSLQLTKKRGTIGNSEL